VAICLAKLLLEREIRQKTRPKKDRLIEFRVSRHENGDDFGWHFLFAKNAAAAVRANKRNKQRRCMLMHGTTRTQQHGHDHSMAAADETNLQPINCCDAPTLPPSSSLWYQ